MALGMSKLNRPRAPLGREEIARAALEMLDEEGIDALSMRRLADRLGVGTMTLYGYFRSKEELLDAAVGAAVAEFRFTPAAGGFRERARAHIAAVREVLERHPALPELRGRQPILQAAAFRMSEPGMRILLDAGFPPGEAARAFRLLFVYVFGSTLFAREPSPEQRRLARAALLSLPEAEFPSMLATAEGMVAALGGPEQFEFGLEVILDGLEARAARHSAASSHQ
jgi:AcrR family transcriptional regulator